MNSDTKAVERALSEAQKQLSGGTQADPGSVPSSEGVRSAAPAEQPRVSRFGRGTMGYWVVGGSNLRDDL